MELIYTGKAKNVYTLKSGNCLFKLKDNCNGKDGKYIEPMTLSDLFFA